MSVSPEWIEHHREDKVLLGWIVPDGEDFATVDLLGRRSEPVDWFSAEQRLEERGLSYLSERFVFQKAPDLWVHVRLLEVSPEGIRIQEGLFDDPQGEALPTHHLAWPLTGELMPLAEFTGRVATDRGLSDGLDGLSGRA
ncbi:MAG: hypothetical protein ACTHZ5_14100 [Micrococcaceae bacterium]